jgi:hypothetical protein
MIYSSEDIVIIKSILLKKRKKKLYLPKEPEGYMMKMLYNKWRGNRKKELPFSPSTYMQNISSTTICMYGLKEAPSFSFSPILSHTLEQSPLLPS